MCKLWGHGQMFLKCHLTIHRQSFFVNRPFQYANLYVCGIIRVESLSNLRRILAGLLISFPLL